MFAGCHTGILPARAASGWKPARRHSQDACVTGFILFRFVFEHDFAQDANGSHAIEQ